jgi:hypothetical protein
MRFYCWVLFGVFLVLMIWHGWRGNDDRCRSWAWVTIGMFLIALFVQVTTEPCDECFTTKDVRTNTERLETGGTDPGWWSPVQPRYTDLPAVSTDLPSDGRHEEDGQ